MLLAATTIVMLIGFALGVTAERIVQNKKVRLARLQRDERSKEFWQRDPATLERRMYQRYSRSSTYGRASEE